MKNIKIKICGMTDPGNVEDVCQLMPDLLGFILHEQSPRYVSIEKAAELVKKVPASVKKTGVLVNKPIGYALDIAKTGIFDILQLHGDETPGYCRKLGMQIQIIKAFRISKNLPSKIGDYQPYCDMFLFDTGGKDFGGSGKKFDHSILNCYNLNTSYILSGGISVSDSISLKCCSYPKIAGVDLNSRFEVSPGIKNISLLEKFIKDMRRDDYND